MRSSGLDSDVSNGMWCAHLLKQKIVLLIFALTIYLYTAVKRAHNQLRQKLTLFLGFWQKSREAIEASEVCQLLWHVINKQWLLLLLFESS